LPTLSINTASPKTTKAVEYYGEKPGFEYPGDRVVVEARSGEAIILPLLMTRTGTLRLRVLRSQKVVSGFNLRINMEKQKPNDEDFGSAFVHYTYLGAGKHELEFTPRSDGQFIVIADW
jgi:hypothetical protein